MNNPDKPISLTEWWKQTECEPTEDDTFIFKLLEAACYEPRSDIEWLRLFGAEMDKLEELNRLKAKDVSGSSSRIRSLDRGPRAGQRKPPRALRRLFPLLPQGEMARELVERGIDQLNQDPILDAFKEPDYYDEDDEWDEREP